MTTREATSPTQPITLPDFAIAGYSLIAPRIVVRKFVLHRDTSSIFADMCFVAGAQSVDGVALLGRLLNAVGRQAFTLTLEDGKLCKLEDSDTPSITPPAFNNFMTLKDIAKAIPRSYSWVSKHWETTMRLTPHHVGATLFFKRTEVEAYIERNVLKHRKSAGRPKKIIGVIRA